MPSASNSDPKRTLPLSAVKRIDDACDAYEQAFAAGTNPRIEDVLAQAPESEAERAALLRDLLALEVDLRLTRGETLTLDDYATRFPGEVAWLRGLLTERTKPLSAAPVPPIGEKLRYFGDYELLDVIARGGMGVVYKARQMKLNRIVALKMILSGRLANDEELRRFKSEAEAAANLEHPDIVPIFEVGEHQGQHYFAMRFIDGQSLAKRVAEGPLPPREAAEMVRRVAEAVQFAHEHGVIHRDLKPGNVLLDSSGKPFVTDFGLSKRVEGDSQLTQSGQILGTPSYMPPEQASGKAQQIGPASDVYSLGAMLYCLVVGRPPFQAATPLETAQQVLRDEPVAPRQLNPAVPRDIETICLKCLNKVSSHRYPTAQELADELARWLRGEPIHARPASLLERVWRWTNRHPSAASAIAAVVLGLIAVSILSFALWRSNEELASANSELIRANRREQEATKEARDNAGIAKEHSAIAISVLQDLVYRIQKDLKYVAGAGPVRKRLLESAINKLSEVSTKFVSQSVVDRDTAMAICEVGELLLRISTNDQVGEGSVKSATKSAQVLFQKALEITTNLSSHHVLDPADQDATRRKAGLQAFRDQAFCFEQMSVVNLRLGQVTEALRYMQQGFAIAERVAATDPNSTGFQYDLATANCKLGEVQLKLGRVSDALDSLERGLNIAIKLSAANPSNTEFQIHRIGLHQWFADASYRKGKLADATEHYRKGLDLAQRLAREMPENAERQRSVPIFHERLGILSLEAEDPAEAIRHGLQACELREKLAAVDPGDRLVQYDLSVSYQQLGDAQRLAKQLNEAIASCQKALVISEQLAAFDPSDVAAQRGLSFSHNKLGNAYLASQNTELAIEHFQKGLEIRHRLAAADPADAQAQRDLSFSHNLLGDVELESNRGAAASEHFKRGHAIRQKLAEQHPTDAQAQYGLMVSFSNLAECELPLDHFEEAKQYFSQGIAILDEMIAKKQLIEFAKRDKAKLEERMAVCDRTKLAIGDWETILQAEPVQLPDVLVSRGTELLKRNDLAGALQAADKLRDLDPKNSTAIYNAACIYALGAELAVKEKTQPTVAEQAERQRLIKLAIASLQQAIAAGFNQLDTLRTDEDFKALRGLPEFEALLPAKP